MAIGRIIPTDSTESDRYSRRWRGVVDKSVPKPRNAAALMLGYCVKQSGTAHTTHGFFGRGNQLLRLLQ